MNLFIQLRIIFCQNRFACAQQQIAAFSGHDTAKEQNMAEGIEIIIQSEGVGKIAANALINFFRTLVTFLHQLLHNLQLFGRREGRIKFYTSARGQFDNAVL